METLDGMGLVILPPLFQGYIHTAPTKPSTTLYVQAIAGRSVINFLPGFGQTSRTEASKLSSPLHLKLKKFGRLKWINAVFTQLMGPMF